MLAPGEFWSSVGEDWVAREHGAKTDAKRVLSLLTEDVADRALEGIAATDLQDLEERGRTVGLADFLEEVEGRLAPLLTGR